jgi:hypothetical protein
MKLSIQTLGTFLFEAIVLGILLFLPAWTLNYWQAWVFMSVFVSASGAVTVYLAIHDPRLLDRRMRAGPLAEKEWSQKFIVSLVMMGFIGLLVVGCLTALGAATGHHTVSLRWVQMTAHGDF